jgi:hypothetical protein
MKLELLLKKSSARTEERGREGCHHLYFRFSGVYSPLDIRISFAPDIAVAYLAQGGVKKYTRRIVPLMERMGTDWSTVLARVVSESSLELLERDKGLLAAVKNCFPGARITPANERFFGEVERPLSCAVDDFYSLAAGLPESGIKGENVVDYLLNEQGKVFPLSFYNKIARGYKFSQSPFAFADPRGVWRGVLLRLGYQHFERKDDPGVVWYLQPSAPVPPGMIEGKPF